MKYLKTRILGGLLVFSLYSTVSARSPILFLNNTGEEKVHSKINELNTQGTTLFKSNQFLKALVFFKKGLGLSHQLHGHKKGILSFNTALTLHKLAKFKEANRYFLTARRYAHNNKFILESKILMMYACGLNPSIPCEEQIPLELNIEGSY